MVKNAQIIVKIGQYIYGVILLHFFASNVHYINIYIAYIWLQEEMRNIYCPFFITLIESVNMKITDSLFYFGIYFIK